MISNPHCYDICLFTTRSTPIKALDSSWPTLNGSGELDIEGLKKYLFEGGLLVMEVTITRSSSVSALFIC